MRPAITDAGTGAGPATTTPNVPRRRPAAIIRSRRHRALAPDAIVPGSARGRHDRTSKMHGDGQTVAGRARLKDLPGGDPRLRRSAQSLLHRGRGPLWSADDPGEREQSAADDRHSMLRDGIGSYSISDDERARLKTIHRWFSAKRSMSRGRGTSCRLCSSSAHEPAGRRGVAKGSSWAAIIPSDAAFIIQLFGRTRRPWRGRRGERDHVPRDITSRSPGDSEQREEVDHRRRRMPRC